MNRFAALIVVLALESAGLAASPSTQPTPMAQPNQSAAIRWPDAQEAAWPLNKIRPEVRPSASAQTRPDELPPQVQGLLDEAEQFIARRQYVAAILNLEKALGQEPQSGRIHRALGRANLLSGNPAKAGMHLQRATACNGNDQEAWLMLGRAQRTLGQEEAALTSLLMAYRCQSVEGDSLVHLAVAFEVGRLLDGSGYRTAALPLLEQVSVAGESARQAGGQPGDVELANAWGPKRTTLLADVARLKIMVGQADQGRKLLESIASADQAAPSVQLAWLAAYVQQKDADKAVGLLVKLASQVKPADAEGLAKSLLAAFESPRALGEWAARAATKQSQPGGDVLTLIAAAVFEQVSDGASARAVLQTAIQANAKPGVLLYLRLIDLQQSAGEMTSAVQTLRAAAKTYPEDVQLSAVAENALASMNAGQAKLLVDDPTIRGLLSTAKCVQGRKALEAKKFAQALALFEEALKLQVDKPLALVGRAAALNKLKRYKESLEDLNRIIQLDPKLAEAYLERSLAHLNLGDNPAGHADADRAIQLGLKNARAYFNRGCGVYFQGREDEALVDFNLAIEVDPTYAWAYNNRCLIYMHRKELDKALSDANEGLRLAPDYVDLLVNRCDLHCDRGDFDLSIADADAAIGLSPGRADAWYCRGRTCNAMGQSEQALPCLTKAVELDPTFAWPYYERGRCYMWNGAWPQAIADWTRVIELKPSYAPPYFLRAELRRQKGDWKTSVPDYQRAIDLTVKEGRDRPDWLWVAYLNLGCCLLNTGKYQEAIANFDKSLELCPDEALTFDARSEANLELGRWEKSISDASKAVELAPDKVESYVTRGVAQMALKRYDAALADFTKSIALAPDDAMHYYDRGLCHYHKGEYTKARPDFEKALTLNITEDRATWIRKWLLATAPQPSREAPPAAQGKTIRIGNAARSSLIVKPTATTRPASGGNQSTRPMVTTPVETTTQAAATTRPAQPSSEAREWIGESNRQIGATSWYVYGLAGAGVAAVCVVVGVLVMRRSRERGSKGA